MFVHMALDEKKFNMDMMGISLARILAMLFYFYCTYIVLEKYVFVDLISLLI